MESGNYGRKCGILEAYPLKYITRVSNLTILMLERFVKKWVYLKLNPGFPWQKQ
jgi:hypothetical protein